MLPGAVFLHAVLCSADWMVLLVMALRAHSCFPQINKDRQSNGPVAMASEPCLAEPQASPGPSRPFSCAHQGKTSRATPQPQPEQRGQHQSCSPGDLRQLVPWPDLNSLASPPKTCPAFHEPCTWGLAISCSASSEVFTLDSHDGTFLFSTSNIDWPSTLSGTGPPQKRVTALMEEAL
ncbi:Hydroxyacid-Oxoacid Transhydrogenase [Manis pentadactyla]|nr:Hydroxyacid-Oxoacid Transhydrogenase [Manis pentadactyla]